MSEVDEKELVTLSKQKDNEVSTAWFAGVPAQLLHSGYFLGISRLKKVAHLTRVARWRLERRLQTTENRPYSTAI